ncbi:hypothetical protein HN011_002888 [Eciton burchellii]|nr:hypothetical protein HN011_002888 [Eciton burchellii]
MKTGRVGKAGSEELAQTFPLRSRCFEADAIREKMDREELLDEGSHCDIFPRFRHEIVARVSKYASSHCKINDRLRTLNEFTHRSVMCDHLCCCVRCAHLLPASLPRCNVVSWKSGEDTLHSRKSTSTRRNVPSRRNNSRWNERDDDARSASIADRGFEVKTSRDATTHRIWRHSQHSIARFIDSRHSRRSRNLKLPRNGCALGPYDEPP